MKAIFQFVLRHGYSSLFAGVFAHQIGLPIPGPLLLLSAGALVAAGKLHALAVVGLTIVACVAADWIWYEAGRRRGDKVLHFMHGLTRDPEYHDRRAKRIFARYGPPLLLVSKFVPGLDAVAPPLAGTSRTSRSQFLALDAVGAALYACAYSGLGYAFSNDLNRAAVYVSRAGRFVLGTVSVAICIYIAHRLIRRARCVSKSQLLRNTSVNPTECGKTLEMSGAIPGGLQNGD